MQKHFNTRAAERLGLRVNRHDVKDYVAYLMRFRAEGIDAGRGRFWYYVCFYGVWSWVLLDRKARRLVTILTEPPRNAAPEYIVQAKMWGEWVERLWA